MSVGARPETAGPPAAGTGLASGPPDAAGRLLGRLSVLPALLAMSGSSKLTGTLLSPGNCG